MKLNKLNIEELVELRTKMILEGNSTREINLLIDKKEREYSEDIIKDNERINEDTSGTGSPGSSSVGGGNCYSGGVGYGNAGIGGMGSVTSPQPSTYAGSTIGSNWSGHGGTIGSGDLGVSFPYPGSTGKKDKFMYQKAPGIDIGKNHGPRTGKKSRTKKLDIKALRNTFAKRQDFTTTADQKVPKKVMNFDDFQKTSFNKITKVKK